MQYVPKSHAGPSNVHIPCIKGFRLPVQTTLSIIIYIQNAVSNINRPWIAHLCPGPGDFFLTIFFLNIFLKYFLQPIFPTKSNLLCIFC